MNKILHILRNPYGFTEEEVREARLAAGDAAEKYHLALEAIAQLPYWRGCEMQRIAFEALGANAPDDIKNITPLIHSQETE